MCFGSDWTLQFFPKNFEGKVNTLFATIFFFYKWDDYTKMSPNLLEVLERIKEEKKYLCVNFHAKERKKKNVAIF